MSQKFFPGLIAPLLQSSVFHQVHYQTVPCSSCQEHWLPNSRIQYGINRAELYFCFKTIPFELSNDVNPFLFNALTVYGPSHLSENFPPFLSSLRLLPNNTLSPTLAFVKDRCRRSKSHFCFSCAFFIFLPAGSWLYTLIVFADANPASNIAWLKGPSYELAGSEFSPYFKSIF